MNRCYTYYFFCVYFLILSLLIPFSLISLFILSISLLFLFSSKFGRGGLALLSIIALICLMYINGSRDFHDEMINDLSIYYMSYIKLSQDLYSELFSFGNGWEVGWTAVFYVISKVDAAISPINIAIINTTICLVIFLFWLHIHELKKLSSEYVGIALAFTITFISIQTFGYLQRQAIATSILLFAISNHNKRRFYGYLIVATMFHLTSLPLGLLYKYLITKKLSIKHALLLSAAIIILKLSFSTILSLIVSSGIYFPGIQKLDYFLSRTSSSITSLRFAVLVIPLLVGVLINWNDSKLDRWKNIILATCVLYVSFLGIPLAPERFNFILLYLYGYFIYIVMYDKNRRLMSYCLFLYIAYLVLEKLNFFNANNPLYWIRYPAFSLYPFYYLTN